MTQNKNHESDHSTLSPDAARVLQSLEEGTEGFKSVLSRLEGTSEDTDFIRPINTPDPDTPLQQ